METTRVEARPVAERLVADEIAALVRRKPSAVLGLATGDTPTGVYRELVRMHREERVSFRGVHTFNLDEYCGLAPDHPETFRSWMQHHLFDHVDVRPEHTHLPDGRPREDDWAPPCKSYERAIEDLGGIDLLLLGIGRNGHIAFNEPGSARTTRTRRVELHPWTREDAVARFGTLARVPTHALTMGIATLLEARAIRVLAFGARKAPIVARTLATTPDMNWPASLLHGHPDVRLLVDREAWP